MNLRFLAAIAASLLVGAGCSKIEPTAPAPPSYKPTPPSSMTFAGTPLPAPAPTIPSFYGPIDSLKRALIYYDGVRPLDRYTGKPMPVVNTRIVGGEQDTIFFNGEKWSHRAEFKKQLLITPDVNTDGPGPLIRVQTAYTYGNPSNIDDIEQLVFSFPNQVGIHRTAQLKSPNYGAWYSLSGSDYGIDLYTLDREADNWVEVTKINEATKQVSARFSLHLKIPDFWKKSLIYSPIVLPSNIHMTGSIN